MPIRGCVTRLGLAACFLVLLSGCQIGGDSAVTVKPRPPIAFPDNLCTLVAGTDLGSQPGLAPVSHSTRSNNAVSTAGCSLSSGEASPTTVEVALTSVRLSDPPKDDQAVLAALALSACNQLAQQLEPSMHLARRKDQSCDAVDTRDPSEQDGRALSVTQVGGAVLSVSATEPGQPSYLVSARLKEFELQLQEPLSKLS